MADRLLLRCWSQGCLPALLLLGATLLAYQPLWHAGFIWDDDNFLTNNPLITRPGKLWQFWFSAVPPDYFPLTSTSLWLEWRLWGANPLGYHLVNVLLHGFSAILWWRLLRAWIPQCEIGAWLTAMLFALHPLNVESVAWITERKNTLAMVFFVLTLLWYVKADGNPPSRLTREDGSSATAWRWYWLSLIAFALALLSKTAAAPLPLLLLLLAWWQRGRITRRDIVRTMPFFIAAAALALVTIWFQSHRAIGSSVIRTEGFCSRLAGAGWAIWFYLYKVFVPVNLMFVYPRWQIDPNRVLSYVPLILFAATVWTAWVFRRSWGKPIVFGLAYFLIMLLPVLGFINIYFMKYSLVSDHWLYFAIIGPIGLIAAVLARAVRLGTRSPWVRIGGVGGLLLLVGALTWNYCGTFSDRETLWRTTLARNPGCATAHNNLGWILLHQKGQVDEAIEHFRTALEIDPDHMNAHENLGYVFLMRGQLDEAMTEFQKTLEIQPDYPAAHNNLGYVFLRKGQPDRAIAEWRKSVELRPEAVEARNNLGSILLERGEAEEAILHFRKALEVQPAYAMARINLGNALLQTGRRFEAVAEYEKAVETQPRNPDACRSLAWVLATCPDAAVRNGVRAVQLGEQANRLSGGRNPVVIGTLAAAYAEAGRFTEAVAMIRQALQIATAQGNVPLVTALRKQADFYQAGSPFRDVKQPSTPQEP